MQGLCRRAERGGQHTAGPPWTLQRGPSPPSPQVPSPSLAFLTCEVRGGSRPLWRSVSSIPFLAHAMVLLCERPAHRTGYRPRRETLLISWGGYLGLREVAVFSAGITAAFPPLPAALFGVLFEKNKEAAFANYRLWEALGFVIAFGYSTFLCVSVKLCILLGVLGAAVTAYGAVEYLESRKADGPRAAARTEPAEEGVAQTKL